MRAEIRSSMATMASALALRVSARLKNMSWGDGDKGAIRSHPLAPSIIAIKTRLFRLRLFDF